jgi:hypothetical protein
MCDGTERDEDEQNVGVRAKEEPFVGFEPRRLTLGFDGLDYALGE